MSRILVSGSLAYDRIMDFHGLFSEHFMPEKLHKLSVSFQVDTFAENFGGCAGNIAYNLALLGQEPEILATAGNDFEKYRTHLLSSGIRPDSIRVRDDEPTSSAFIMTDREDNQIAAFSLGAGKYAYEPLQETEGCACAIVAAGNPADMKALAKQYRENEVEYFYDPGQALTALSAEELRAGISGARALFGNDYELDLIVQKTGWSEQELLGRVPTLVVTLGEKGARIVTKDGETNVRASRVEDVVDPTGAGDAHRSGFVRGMLAGLPLLACGQLASTVAAYAVEKYGTQNHRFTLAELKGRYQENYGEDIGI